MTDKKRIPHQKTPRLSESTSSKVKVVLPVTPPVMWNKSPDTKTYLLYH